MPNLLVVSFTQVSIPDSAYFLPSGSQVLKTWACHIVFGFPVLLDWTLTHQLSPTITQNERPLQALSFDKPLKYMSVLECSH